MTPSAPRRSSGFSLLETLVGLTLTALIAAAVTSAIRTSIRMWNASESTLETSEETRLMGLATTWLEHAVSDRVMNTEPGTTFSGTKDAVSFMVTGMVGPDKGGLSRLRIEAQPSDDCLGQSDLALVWSEVAPNQGYPAYGESSRPILPCQDSIQFSYFGYADGRTEPAWRSDWPRNAPLPAIVAISTAATNSRHQVFARLQFSAQPLSRPDTADSPITAD